MNSINKDSTNVTIKELYEQLNKKRRKVSCLSSIASIFIFLPILMIITTLSWTDSIDSSFILYFVFFPLSIPFIIGTIRVNKNVKILKKQIKELIESNEKYKEEYNSIKRDYKKKSILVIVIAVIIYLICATSSGGGSNKDDLYDSVKGEPWKDLGVSKKEYMEIYNKYKYGE